MDTGATVLTLLVLAGSTPGGRLAAESAKSGDAVVADQSDADETPGPAVAGDDTAPPVPADDAAAESVAGDETVQADPNAESTAASDGNDQPSDAGPGPKQEETPASEPGPAAGEVEEIRAAPTGSAAHTAVAQSGQGRVVFLGLGLRELIGWGAVAAGGATLATGVTFVATRKDITKSFELPSGRKAVVTRENSTAPGWVMVAVGGTVALAGGFLLFVEPQLETGWFDATPTVAVDGQALYLSLDGQF